MKYAVVTGGTSGMGLGVAKMLVDKGYYVFTTYVGPEFTEKIDNYEAHLVDQTNRGDVYSFINYVKSKTNHLDCLVCNAGMSIRKSFTETTDADWDKQMEVAVNSHYIMVREFFPIIPEGSRILFTGSQMAVHPHATVLAYGVTKSAVCALAKNLVKEFEGTGTGFSFANYDARDLLNTINYSKKVFFEDKDAWTEMQKRAMQQDYSWIASAKIYEKLYEEL